MHLVDYVLSVSTKTFAQMPFNEVDALVFAQIAYYDFSVFVTKKNSIDFENPTYSSMTTLINSKISVVTICA